MNNATEQIFIMNSSDNQPSSTTQKLMDIPGGTLQVNLENIQDFSNVCRTCATVTEFVIPIFDGEGLQNNLADKIHKHLPIRVTEQDVLPRVVCYQCASTLLAWHELVTCCVQADAALRSRLPVRAALPTLPTLPTLPVPLAAAPKQPPKPPEGETSHNVDKNEQSKFKEISAFEGEVREPPQYVESSTSPAPDRIKTCGFCKSDLPERVYNDHLVGAHAELLFHCEECDTYVDRKDFIMHMSLHAVQYANTEKNGKPEKIRKIIRRRFEISTSQKLPETPPAPAPKKPKEVNEFSDQSDIEFGFEPLPESVFEAIEDSEERPIQQTNQTETEPQGVDVPDKKDKPKAAKWFRSCPICSKGYTASSSYFYHMKHFHTKSKEHSCEVCGKKFATKANLAEHGSIHSGEMKLECAVCKKRFRARASLYIHSQTHGCGGGGGGGARHSCSWCGRGFRWRGALARHVARHAARGGGARAHACWCGRAFPVRCDLRRHERTHAAGEHVCTHCGLKFAQLRYLKVHLHKKHSDVSGASETK